MGGKGMGGKGMGGKGMGGKGMGGKGMGGKGVGGKGRQDLFRRSVFFWKGCVVNQHPLPNATGGHLGDDNADLWQRAERPRAIGIGSGGGCDAIPVFTALPVLPTGSTHSTRIQFCLIERFANEFLEHYFLLSVQ
jgi:hypothetical protein